jgi:hypothetical protein
MLKALDSKKMITILFELSLSIMCFSWFFGIFEPPTSLIALPLIIDSFFGFTVLILFLIYLTTHLGFDLSKNQKLGKKDKELHKKSIVIFLFLFLVFALVSITGDTVFEPIKLMLRLSIYTSSLKSVDFGIWAIFVAVLVKNTLWALPGGTVKTYPKFLSGCIDKFIQNSFLLILRATVVIIFSAILLKSVTLSNMFVGSEVAKIVALLFGVGYFIYALLLYLRYDEHIGELFNH